MNQITCASALHGFAQIHRLIGCWDLASQNPRL
jgi:hypothetical protein